MSWVPFWKRNQATEKSIYEKRIDCLARMLDNQRIMNLTDKEYKNISLVEGKAQENILNRLEIYQTNYKNTYSKCEKILKPH